MADLDPSLDLSFLARLPDQDVEQLIASVKEGATKPGDFFGFDEPALNSVEQVALAFYRGSKFHESSLIFAFMLRMNPERVSAWRGLGACAQALKRVEAAVGCYQMALARDPDDIVSLVFLGEAMCQVGEREAGLTALKAAVERGAKKPDLKAYVLRARAVITAGGGMPSRVILSGKGHDLVAKADALLGGDIDETERDQPLTIAHMKRNPKLAASIKDLERLLKQGKISLAEVGGFSQKELDGAYVAAVKLFEAKQVPQAMQLVGFLMLVSPYEARYYQLSGICLQQLKQYIEAGNYFRYAMALEPDDPRTLIYAGECEVLAGNIDDGLKLVRSGVKKGEGKREADDAVKRGQALLKRFGR